MGNEPVELTAETITNYLSKLCKNTVSIYKTLETIHNDNLEIKKSLDKLLHQNISTPFGDIRKQLISKDELQTIKQDPILTTDITPPTKETIAPIIVKEPELTSPIQIPQAQTTILPGEQPLTIKDQIQLALRKKQLDNSQHELRCNKQQVVWLGGSQDDQKLLNDFKPDTRGLV